MGANPSTSSSSLGESTNNNIQTFFIDRHVYTENGLATFSDPPPPYATAPETFKIEDNGASVRFLKPGTVSVDVTLQIRSSTGKSVLIPTFGLNGQALPNTSSRTFFPAFLTGFLTVLGLALAINVQAGDVMQLQLGIEQVDQGERIGQIFAGGPSSFLVLSFSG